MLVLLALAFTLESPLGPAPGKQNFPDAAWNGESWLAVWRDEREPGSSMPAAAFYATRISAAGEPLDAAGVRLAAIPPGDVAPTVIACGPRWLVTWAAYGGGIHAVRVDGKGRLLDEKPIAVYANATSGMISAACAGESAVIVWSDSARSLYGVHFDLAKGRVREEKAIPLIATDKPESHNYPAIAWNGKALLVTWHHHADMGRSQTIRAMRYGPDLRPLDPAPQIIGPGEYPRVAASGDAFLVIFSRAGGDWKKPEVHAALVTGGGQVPKVKQLALGAQPKVTGISDGWAVAWAGHEGQPAELMLVGRDLDVQPPRKIGTPPKAPPSPKTGGAETLNYGWGRVDIAAGTDSVLVSWEERQAYWSLPTGWSTIDHDAGEIVSARVPISAEGGIVQRRLSTGPPRQLRPVLASDGASWTAAWLEQDGVGKRVMAARLGKKGFTDARGVMLSAEGATILQGPAIGAGGGMALVAWTGETGTFAARLDAKGKVLDVPPLSLGGRGARPSVAFDGTRFLVAWGDGGDLQLRSVGVDGTLGEPQKSDRGAFPEAYVHLACLKSDCIVVWASNHTLEGARIVNGIAERPKHVLYERTWLPHLTAGRNRFHLSWNAQTHAPKHPEMGSDVPDDVLTVELDASLPAHPKVRSLLSSKMDERLVAADWFADDPTILWFESPGVQHPSPTLRLSHRGRAETIRGGTGGDVRRSTAGIAVLWTAAGRIEARVYAD